MFFLFVDRLYEGKTSKGESIHVNEELGGHSSVFTIRAQYEDCKAFLTPFPSEFNLSKLKRPDLSNGEKLVIPLDLMEIPEYVNRNSKQDVHLVFEYLKDDEILGVKAPRSNRFYFVHDPNGSNMTQLETYHDVLDKMDEASRPYRHMFGGY